MMVAEIQIQISIASALQHYLELDVRDSKMPYKELIKPFNTSQISAIVSNYTGLYLGILGNLLQS